MSTPMTAQQYLDSVKAKAGEINRKREELKKQQQALCDELNPLYNTILSMETKAAHKKMARLYPNYLQYDDFCHQCREKTGWVGRSEPYHCKNGHYWTFLTNDQGKATRVGYTNKDEQLDYDLEDLN